LPDQAQHRCVQGQGEAPDGELILRIVQAQGADAGVIVVLQRQRGIDGPVAPLARAGVARHQPAVGEHQRGAGKAKLSVEVNLQAPQNVLSCSQRQIDAGFVLFGLMPGGMGGVVMVHGVSEPDRGVEIRQPSMREVAFSPSRGAQSRD